MDSRRYPSFPIPGVAAIVGSPLGLLLIKRKKPPGEGFWSMPGGGVEIGETQAEALVREVREETGVLTEVIGFVDTADVIETDSQGRVEYHFILNYYAARAVSQATTPGGDEADARWVRPEELGHFEMLQRVRKMIEKHLPSVVGLMLPR